MWSQGSGQRRIAGLSYHHLPTDGKWRLDRCNLTTRQSMTAQEVLTRTHAEVVAATGAKQLPWSTSPRLGEVLQAEK